MNKTFQNLIAAILILCFSGEGSGSAFLPASNQMLRQTIEGPAQSALEKKLSPAAGAEEQTNPNASFDQLLSYVPTDGTVIYRLYKQVGDTQAAVFFISPAPLEKALVELFGSSAPDMDYSVEVSDRPDQPKTTWIDIAPRQLIIPGDLTLGQIQKLLVEALGEKSLPVAKASVTLYLAEIINNTNQHAYGYQPQLNTRVTLTWNGPELRAVLEDQAKDFFSLKELLEQSLGESQPADDPMDLVRELFGQLDKDQSAAAAAGKKAGGKMGTPLLRRAYREGLFSLAEETYAPGEGTRRVFVFRNPVPPSPPPKKLSPEAVEIRAAYGNKRYAVGVDITREGFSVALSGPDNKVERRTAPPMQKWSTTGGTLDPNKNPELIVAALVNQIAQMVDDTGLSGDRLSRVVVSIVAAVNDEASDGETGNPQPAPYLPAFDHYSLSAVLQEKLSARLGGKASAVVSVYNRGRASLLGELSAIGTIHGVQNAAFFYFGPGISGDLAANGRPVSRSLGFLEVGRVTTSTDNGKHYEYKGRELKGMRFQPTTTELQVEQLLSEPALEKRVKALGYDNAEVAQEIGRFMAAALAPYLTGTIPEVIPQRTVLAGSVVHRLAVALGPAPAIGLIREALSSELISHFHADPLIAGAIANGIIFSRIGTDEERQFAAALTLLKQATSGLEETPDDLAARLVAALVAENREGDIQLTQREAARLFGGSPSQSFLSNRKELLAGINQALPEKLAETKLTKVQIGNSEKADESEEAVAADVNSIIPVLLETIAAGLRGGGPRKKDGRKEVQFTVEDGVASISSQTLNKILPEDLSGSLRKTQKLHEAFAALEVRLEITDRFRAILSREKPSDGYTAIFWETDNAKLLRSEKIWRVQIVPPRDAVEFFAESAHDGDSTMLAVQEIERRANRGASFTMNEVWTVLLLFHNLVLRDAADQTFNRFLDDLKRRFPEQDPLGDFRSARLVWQRAYPVLQESLDLSAADELEHLFSEAAKQIEQELPKDRGPVVDFSPSRTVLPPDKTSAGLEESGRNARWQRNHQQIIQMLHEHPGETTELDALADRLGLSKDTLQQHRYRDLIVRENKARGEAGWPQPPILIRGIKDPRSESGAKPVLTIERAQQLIDQLNGNVVERLEAADFLFAQTNSVSLLPSIARLLELFTTYQQREIREGNRGFDSLLGTAVQKFSPDQNIVGFWNAIRPVLREAKPADGRPVNIPQLYQDKLKQFEPMLLEGAAPAKTAAEILRLAFVRDGQIDPRISPFLDQSPTEDAQEKDIRWVKAFLALMAAPPQEKTALPPLSVSEYNAGPFLRNEISEEILRDYVENEWIAALEKTLRGAAEQITRQQPSAPVTAEDLGLKQIQSLMRSLSYAEDSAGQRLFPNLSESEIYRWSYRDLPRLLVPLISPSLSRAHIPAQLLEQALANPLSFSNESGNRAAAAAIRTLLQNQPETFTDNPVKLRRNPGKKLLPWLRLAIALNLIDYSQPALAREIEQAGGVMHYVLPRMGTDFSEALGGERFIHSFIADILKPGQSLVHITDNNAEIAGSLKLAELLLSVNPTLTISMIVKVDNGVMNDASLDDARRLLEKQPIYEKLRQYQAIGRFRLIPGARSHGTPLNRLTPEAVSAIRDAGVVLSQGEANTWNLNGLAKPLIYLGLRLKWLTGIENIFGVAPDPERPPAFIKIDGTQGAYFQNPFGTLPNVPRVTIRQTVLAQNPEMTAGVVLADPKPLRDSAYGETRTVSIERPDRTLTGRAVLIHPAKTLIRQRLNPQVINGSWEWKGLRRLTKTQQPGDPLMGIIDKPSSWNNLSLPLDAEPIFASNSLQTNFWEPNGFLIIDGKLVAIPGVRQAEEPWVFVLEAADSGKTGLRRLKLTEGVPQTDGIREAVAGPVLVRDGKSVASKIRHYPTEGGAANADADLSEGAYANRTRWDPNTTYAAFSALGRTGDNQLIFLSLVGQPETGQKQASVEDVTEAMIKSGAVEAILLGGSMDVQQWAVDDGTVPVILGRHNNAPHDSLRNLNAAIVVYTNPSAGQEETVSAGDTQDRALAQLSVLYSPTSAAPESTVLVFENPETFDLIPMALQWGWRVAILSDGAQADALRSLLAQMRVPRERYAIGYLEASNLLDNPTLRLISIQNREQGLRQLGLNPDDLPSPVALALDAVQNFLESMA